MANNLQLASDYFAGGALNPGWSAISGWSTGQVISGTPNVTEPNVLGTNAGQIWTGQSWPNDQISEVTLNHALSVTGCNVALVARFSNAAQSGYVAVAEGNGSLQLFSGTNGTYTQIGATQSGLTWSAQDVLTFMVAGCCLSFYQNGILRYAYYDTTYTGGGYPGYYQIAVTSLANSQVSSWRGYSLIQQDGVWQKQGVVIPATSADLSGATAGVGIQICTVLYDSNPQILSGSNVFKTWIVSDWSNDATSSMYYAESLDGKSWTRRASAVLSDVTNGAVFKFGGTYYMYAQAAGSSGSGNQLVYTSSDGISWSAQSPTSVLAAGGSGAWDRSGFYNICTIFGPIAGTYYGYYIGGASGGFATGLATSTDLINWTKYASNPVISAGSTASVIRNASAQVGSTYYMWCTASLGSILGGTTLDPFECVRYKSTNLTTWTLDSHSMHRQQMYESLNSVKGGLIPAAILNVGGRAYMWCDSSMGDASGPQIGQVSLAIAPVSIAALVTQPETATTQVASDNFSGTLSNWTIAPGGIALQISGGLLEATATASNCFEYYSAKSFAPNQYSEATIHTLLATGSYIYLVVRTQTTGSTLNGYFAQIPGPTGSSQVIFNIQRFVNGSGTVIGPNFTSTPNVGDVFRLSVVTGSDGFPVLSLYQNGFLIAQVIDYLAKFAAGSPGILLAAASAVTNVQISAWSGGNSNVIPNYGSGHGPNIFESNGLKGTPAIMARNRFGLEIAARIR